MPLFFLSYARADAGDDLTRFYRKLSDEIRRQSGELEPVGFRDESNIEPGARWSEELATALTTSSTFIPLYSPSYFTREYCGREWAYFSQRISSATGSGKVPPLVIPVLWDSLDQARYPTPRVATEVQYTHEDFGKEYAQFGLRYIMRLNEFADAYEKFVYRFARKVLDTVREFPLEPADEIVPLEQIESVFRVSTDTGRAAETRRLPGGARAVQFLVIAGSAEELQRVRTDVAAYGDSNTEWMPCYPHHDDRIAPLIQGVAAEEGLMSHVVEQNNLSGDRQDLRGKLDQAKENRNIVLLVADNWSLLVDVYADIVREYDTYGHYNATAVVPWSRNDPEIAKRERDLINVLERTFENTRARAEETLRIWISDPDELREMIRIRLVAIRNRILSRSEGRAVQGLGRGSLPQMLIGRPR